jgi:hypothetical protein
MAQGSFDLRSELHAKNVFWAPSEALVMPFSIQKPVKNTKNELLTVNDSEAHFSVSNRGGTGLWAHYL